MPRFLVELDSGVSTADAQPLLASVQGVQDVTQSRAFNGFIVSSDASAKREIANQPGVAAVYDDIQAVPQVADPDAQEDFLRRVREVKGEDTPPTTETEPLTGDDDIVKTDGGARVGLPLTRAPAVPQDAEPEFRGLLGSLRQTNVLGQHNQGFKGDGAIVVVVDTGVCGDQIADERQMEGADLTDENDPWTDYMGHGSLAACIAAGGPETVGENVGFAPEAKVFPIKSTLSASELIQAQDIILDLVEEHGGPVVVNNSWGFPQCTGLCDHPVTKAMDSTAQEPGVFQVLAAGNQGEKCGQACDETGISGPNSLDSVMTVAATGQNGDPTALMDYSSRGGKEASCGTEKPEVAAPIFGELPWECGVRSMANSGGTSAAAPQVTGLAAIIAAETGKPRDVVFTSITSTADQVNGSGWDGCTGYGNIDGERAVTAASGAGGFVSPGRLVENKAELATLAAGIGGTLLAVGLIGS